MSGHNIVIIGGGFAGISALRRLLAFKNSSLGDVRIILVDRKESSEFLPMLPDVAGGWMNSGRLGFDLKAFCDERRVEYLKDEVTAVDMAQRKIYLSGSSLDYEFLLICSGSETNFFNNQNARANCLKLDEISDAVKIREALLERAKEKANINIAVIGGGYTGIEIASNAALLLKKAGVQYKAHILEKGPDILMMAPEWMRKEVRKELSGLSVEIYCNDSFKECGGRTLFLESGKKIDNAFCIWAAGVKAASFIDKIAVEKERTRIKVAEDLRIAGATDKNIFIAGDAAYFFDNKAKAALRMAVMFSMGQGRIAAQNVINSISGKPLVKYRPVDLGYLIPMAHGRAPGIIMGRKIRGRLGYLMHYYMCIYRSAWKNKAGIIKDLILKMS